MSPSYLKPFGYISKSSKSIFAALGVVVFANYVSKDTESLNNFNIIKCDSTNEKLDIISNKIIKIEKNIKDNNSNKVNRDIDMIVGAQWGDEGKGKLVDVLSQNYDYCARVAGGSNAGHTIVVDGKKYKFHLVPSGILNKDGHCLVGNGVVVHLRGLMKELKELEDAGVDYKGRLHLSDRAHIVFDFHQTVDGLNEERLAGKKLGTTRKGIGPAYGSKVMRNGLRIGDLYDMEYFETRLRALASYFESAYSDLGLKIDVEKELDYYKSIRNQVLDMTTDSAVFIKSRLNGDKRMLIEGANATMIDLDFGTYPYVTSSNPTTGGAITGLGVSPHRLGEICGIVKAYCTRVGEGPFPTELHNDTGEFLQKNGGEFGTTTGRPRRCGWIDVQQLQYASQVNGMTTLNLTKIDVLTGLPEVKIGVRYLYRGQPLVGMPASLSILSNIEVEYETLPGWQEDITQIRDYDDLPVNCKRYIDRLEELIGVPIRWIGVGPGREALIDRGEHKSTK